MYRALDVANYVLAYYADNNYELCSSISNLKLQKVLYFLQANHLCTLGKRLFLDELRAVDFGTLVKEVWDGYKIYGGSNILLQRKYIEEYKSRIHNEDKQIINEMLEELKPYSSDYLCKIITNQTPWKNAYYDYNNKSIYCKHNNKFIKDKDLIEFFSKD